MKKTENTTRKAARLNPDFSAAVLEMEGENALAEAVRAGSMTAEEAEAARKAARAVEREAGEARRAALLAEIERQAAAAEAAAHMGRPEDIAEARRETRRARERVRLLGEALAAAVEDGDEETAEALAERLAAAEDIRDEAAAELAAIDPRARMTAHDFLTIDPAESEKAIAAAVYGAARLLARKSEDTAAAIVARYGEDARQAAFLRAWERAALPKYAAAPLALFLAREAGNALARERYAAGRAAHIAPAADIVRDKYNGSRPAAVVDTDYHAAGRVPSPEAAVIEAERLPEALAAVREDYRENAAAIVAAIAAGYTVTEAAEAVGVSAATASRLLAAVRAAAAIVRADEGERAAIERVIDSDRNILGYLRREARRAAEALAVYGPRPEAAAPVVTWTAPRPAVAHDMGGLSYTERVIYAAANQNALAALFSRD